MTEEQINNSTTTQEETTTASNEGAEQSTPTVQKRKLTDEEKREILRKRRLEKIKVNGESRINKIMYGDSAPVATSSITTTSESVESKDENVPTSSVETQPPPTNQPVTPVIAQNTIPSVEKPSSYPSPVEALNLLLHQKVEEAYSPLFKLHDPKLIEKETREYNQPITVEQTNSTIDTQQQQTTSAIPNLSNWDKDTKAKAKLGLFEKLRPLFIMILSFICAISTIYHNEKLHFGAAGLDTLLGYFAQFTPVTVLITFELAIILPGLLSGKSIFSMHTESALDMFLFAKGIWVSVDRFISDIMLFLFVFIVSFTVFMQLHSTLKIPIHQQNESMESIQQQIEQLLKQ